MGVDATTVDLVFEGGGVKGIGLAGAFWELERQGFTPHSVAGTSAGAITAALVAAGYRGDELEALVLHDMDFRRFADGEGGVLGDLGRLLDRKGLHSGDYFRGWIGERLAAKGLHTFGQLRIDDPPNDRAPYRLKVIAADLSRSRMLILPDDAADIGVDPDELLVADAIRMSMSIPIFFTPVVRPDPAGGGDHVIVDGGLLSNFPVWLFDLPEGQVPRRPTFGMLLVAPDDRTPLVGDVHPGNRNMTMVEFLEAIAHTAMEAHDRLYLQRASFARTITIPTLGVGTTQFDITPDRAAALFASGVEAAATFLEHWDFADYLATFRSGAPQPSRREVVARIMHAQATEGRR